jgi:membrane peptidoglycan carboxypeptidase
MTYPPRRMYGYQSLNSKQTPPPKPGRFFHSSRLKTVMYLTLGFGAFCFIGITVIFFIASKDLQKNFDPAKQQEFTAQSTRFFDSSEQHLLYETYGDQKRTLVTLDQMSEFLPKAVIAIEDKDFYKHNGIRIPSMLRAGFSNLFRLKTGRGGASTITQQFLKNRVFGQQESLIKKVYRKIKEAIMAVEVEKKSNKDTILTAYLNEIWFGATNYGVESAAQTYFGKKSKDLDLAESATVAALIQNPARYLKNAEVLDGRRDTVLDYMYEQGYISKEQKEQAQSESPQINLAGGVFEAQHFVMYVRDWMDEKFGQSAVRTGGFKVITTLDYNKQKIAEPIMKELGEKFVKENNAEQTAFVALEPKTGKILALVGSYDFNCKTCKASDYDHVTKGSIQPGSSFKPFIFLNAFEKGYTPETVIYDTPTNFSNGERSFEPKNALGTFNGLVTFRKALQGSLNIPAVKASYLIGGEKGLRELAERFGYTLNPDATYGLSFAIGGGEVNMLQHAVAYNTLANNGTYLPPAAVLRVENNRGEILYQWKPEPKEIVKPEFVATLNSVLTDNASRIYIFGPNNKLVLPGRPVAAKTGTTDKSYDAWTLGYTPSLTAGVWVGKPKNGAGLKGGGETLAGQIWNRFMSTALKDTPVEKFPTPPKIPSDLKPILNGNSGGIKLKINSLNGKIASSSTPSDLIIEKTFLPPHDILFYVKRDDPRGPMPENPADDDQYDNWEAGLQKWIELEQSKGRVYTFEDVPTEHDTSDLSLSPIVEILSPTSSSITSPTINLSAKAVGPRGVSRVDFLIDNLTIGSKHEPPFTISYDAQNLPKGGHRLQIIATDETGNQGYKTLVFNIQDSQEPPSVSWIGEQKINTPSSDFPKTFSLSPFRWDEIKDVKVLLISGSKQKTLKTFSNSDSLSSGALIVSIDQSPPKGTHTLKAIATDATGKISEKEITITIP